MPKLSDERVEEFNQLFPQQRWDALVAEFGGPEAAEHWKDIEARRTRAPKDATEDIYAVGNVAFGHGGVLNADEAYQPDPNAYVSDEFRNAVADQVVDDPEPSHYDHKKKHE